MEDLALAPSSNGELNLWLPELHAEGHQTYPDPRNQGQELWQEIPLEPPLALDIHLDLGTVQARP